MDPDQVAHDLAMAYVNNRYGPQVTGSFAVTSSTNFGDDSIRDVTGGGSVETERLPDVSDPVMVKVGTGSRHLFGVGPERKQWKATADFAVDDVFRRMIADYHAAYARFTELLRA